MTKLEEAFEHMKTLPKKDQDFIADWITSIGSENDDYVLSEADIADLHYRQTTTKKTVSVKEALRVFDK